MANELSTCSELAVEVAALLRQDNISSLIYAWLGFTYADMAQRVPLELFHQYEEVTIADGESSAELTSMPGTMVACTFVNAGKLYLARQVPPTDFDRITKVGSTIYGATAPQVWTLANDEDGDFRIFISPQASGDTVATLLYSGDYELTVTGGTILELPYHCEHALVWGAAALGALAVRPPLYQAYRAEYEEALADLQQTLSYHPDSVPLMRSITGPYTGTPRLSRISMSNMPEQI